MDRSQVPLENTPAREVPLRDPRQAREYTVRTNAKSKIEFQESVRSQMEFGSESESKAKTREQDQYLFEER